MIRLPSPAVAGCRYASIIRFGLSTTLSWAVVRWTIA